MGRAQLLREFLSTPREVHRLAYGFLTGFFLVWRLKGLKKEIRVGRQAFKVWERTEGQYQDIGLALGFFTKYGVGVIAAHGRAQGWW